MTITSHPATDEYRDGWDRVFGRTERRRVWFHINGSPFAIRRFMTTSPLIEGAAYGTQIKERRVLPDRRASTTNR